MRPLHFACLTFSLFVWDVCSQRVFGEDSIDPTDPRPHVLFIAIDDLNDWAQPFGGHPQAKTPNLARFAAEGAVVFQNAHCPGPVCGPSRSALLSGMMPHRTGVYGNAQNMRNSEAVKAHATLPEYFAKHGYQTKVRGKIFHAHSTAGGNDHGQWAFQEHVTTSGNSRPDWAHYTSRSKNLIDGKSAPKSKYTGRGGSEFAWGPTAAPMKETRDYLTATWAADQISHTHEVPLFLAVGLSKPHLPFVVPQEFFDRHPVDGIILPTVREDDLDDIQRLDGSPMYFPSDDYQWLKQQGQMKHAVQAYLAASSYADACLGVIFDALRDGPMAKNTIVVVWGDHGWHLGEKMRYRKATPWSESTRCPLMIRIPGHNQQQECQSLANLIDLYPTLIDYCGLPTKAGIDGVSLKPLLHDPSSRVRDFTTTIFGEKDASITDGNWRYIHHRNGAEQLYDLNSDPHEWNNLTLSSDPDAVSAKQRLAAQVPDFVPTIAGSPRAKKIQVKETQPKKTQTKGLDRGLKNRDLESLK